MKSYEYEQLIKKVSRELRKKAVKFSAVANDFKEDGNTDITANYLWKIANYNKNGGIRSPSPDRLILMAEYFGIK